MPTLEDVARLALGLPDVTEVDRRGARAWAVGGRVFAWERPFSKADLKRFGAQPHPVEPIVAVGLADLGEKQAVLGAHRPGVFTIAHFDNYPAVLIELATVEEKALRGVLVDGWSGQAPETLVVAYFASRREP